MSIPELLFGFGLPLVLLLGLRWLTTSWHQWGRILAVAFTLLLGELGLVFVGRKWKSLTTADDWNQLVNTALDKYLTPTIAFDWLPIAIVSFAVAYLIMLWVVRTRSRLWQAFFLFAQWFALAALIYGMLSGSTYITREPLLWKKLANVAVPALLLWSGWLVATGIPEKGESEGKLGEDANVLSGRESKLGWLSALAIILSAALLILSSGSASTGIQATVAAIVPATMFWDRSFQARRGSVLWLHSVTGILVILGFFFAEVAWYVGLAWFVSSCLLIRYWPTVDQSLSGRWLQAFAVALPALAAAFYSAAVMAIEMSGSTSEY